RASCTWPSRCWTRSRWKECRSSPSPRGRRASRAWNRFFWPGRSSRLYCRPIRRRCISSSRYATKRIVSPSPATLRGAARRGGNRRWRASRASGRGGASSCSRSSAACRVSRAPASRISCKSKASAGSWPDVSTNTSTASNSVLLERLPMALTWTRMALIPVFVAVFYMPLYVHSPLLHWLAPPLSAFLFALAGITDWLDGWLARRWSVTSKLGAFLDPVADKILVAVALVVLVQADGRILLALPAAVIIGREITISALREWMAESGARSRVAVSW